MKVKNKITLYTEGLISGLEKYCSKSSSADGSTQPKPYETKRSINSNPFALALVIDKARGNVLVQPNKDEKHYNLPLTSVVTKDDYYNSWKPCLKNLKENYGIIAQIGGGLGTIYPMQRFTRKINTTVMPSITWKPFKQYQVFEMKSYEQTDKSKAVWKNLETVFVDLLRWRKYEQVEALLRSHYVSKNSRIQRRLSHINYFRIKKWQYQNSNYLYSCFQKNSMNVFSSCILKQKVGEENYILLAKKGKCEFEANDIKTFWNLPQFPVKLSDYPNFQDIPDFYLGDHLNFKNSLLFVKVLFSAPVEDKSSFYDTNLKSTKKDQLLSWDFERVSKDLKFDFKHLSDGHINAIFENKNSRNSSKKKTVNTSPNFMTNDMLYVDPLNNVYVENYYFDSNVSVKSDAQNALDSIYKHGISYCWVKESDASTIFAERGNHLESILMRNYTSSTYLDRRKRKLSFKEKEAF